MSGAPERTAGSSRFLTLSNLLSISRAVLVIPFVFVMLPGSLNDRWWGLLIMAVGSLTDRLDGYYARKLDQVTEWGKILDPLADKVAIAAVAVVLWLRHDLPAWFLMVLLGRDVVIFAGGMWLRQKRGVVLASNTAGKWTVGIVALALGAALFRLPEIVQLATIGTSMGMVCVSLTLYGKRFIEVFQVQPGSNGNS